MRLSSDLHVFELTQIYILLSPLSPQGHERKKGKRKEGGERDEGRKHTED